jgi:hypothetical protein
MPDLRECLNANPVNSHPPGETRLGQAHFAPDNVTTPPSDGCR